MDLVPELAALAAREGLWFHVDAAYGGAARLSARDAARVPGLELADSVTVDPHKWFFQAYDLGALVVRDGDHLRQTFDRSPEYYRGGEAAATGASTAPAGDGDHDATHDAHAGQLNFYKLGFEGTRRFRALKLWASWKHLGHVRASAGWSRRTTTSPRTWRARCAEADDLEAVPGRARALRRLLPAPAGRGGGGRGDGPARRSTRTRTACAPRSRCPATAGSPRPRCAAGPTCAPAS